MQLKRNQELFLRDGRKITVTDRLGVGGQGVVYKVRTDSGENKALKWYFETKLSDPEGFYRHLAQNIEAGSPSPAFIWPEELTEWTNGTFGYIMPIYPKGYDNFAKFITARVNFKNIDAMINAALNIVTAFMDLHNKGYNYQDLNDGNFSINPVNGDALICDNDNVGGHGFESGILGKSRYMAPEVVRREKKPDKLTDRFSLAVVLFILLMGNHPLEGKRTNVPALTSKYEKRFFGDNPLFIFDPNDDSNRPVEGLHRNAIDKWPYFPSYIQEAFIRSFSQESLLKGNDRLLETMWRHVLMRLKASLVRCPHCHESVFAECEKFTCPACGENIKPAGYIKFSKRANTDILVPIMGGARLFTYHIDENAQENESIAAHIMEKPGKFGIKNESTSKWTITAPDGTQAVKKPGDVAVIGEGFKLDFGHGVIGEVAKI